MSEAGVSGIVLRDLVPGDMGWVIGRHGALYAAEYGWDSRFEAMVARVGADFLDAHDPDWERGWIAEWEGERLGCAFVVRAAPGVAKLRLVLVEPAARAKGYRRMVLWTNDVLVAARAIYQKEGFRLRSGTPQSDFGPTVISEDWELDL